MICYQRDRWHEPKKKWGTKIDPWGTPALKPFNEKTGLKTVHKETGPFKISLCFPYFKKSDKTMSSLSEMLFCFSLKEIIPKIYQTLLRYQEKNLSLQTLH